jgi:predicted esterase
LLVLLHGDGQTASTLFAAWQGAAAVRGVALLALACPEGEGCAGSWWRWNGPPSWIARQVEGVAAQRAIDPARVWLAGWSGGASYIGWRTQELEGRFSAIILMGGGIAPGRGECPASAARVYFLVGDANPLHGLAEQLRNHYEACGQDVLWKLLPGAAHAAEWAAVGPATGRIFDWLGAPPEAAERPPTH